MTKGSGTMVAKRQGLKALERAKGATRALMAKDLWGLGWLEGATRFEGLEQQLVKNGY